MASLNFRKTKDGSLVSFLNGNQIVVQRHVPTKRDRRTFSMPPVVWEAFVDGESVGIHATRRAAAAQAVFQAKEFS
jgi:hypothetical protein